MLTYSFRPSKAQLVSTACLFAILMPGAFFSFLFFHARTPANRPHASSLSRLVSMQIDNPMESSILPDDTDEEEVWLYWIDSNKEPHGKAIRHLAQEAKEGTKADLEVLTYYRWVCWAGQHLFTISQCHLLWFLQKSAVGLAVAVQGPSQPGPNQSSAAPQPCWKCAESMFTSWLFHTHHWQNLALLCIWNGMLVGHR